MKTQLTFAATLAAVIDYAASLAADVTIYAQHEEPKGLARPAMAVLVEGFGGSHPSITKGTLVLRYLSDADQEASTTAVANLEQAHDYLFTGAGRSALRNALAAAGIWLRVLAPTESTSAEDGDRTRLYERRYTVWLQTAMP